jgi:hypothetical protein
MLLFSNRINFLSSFYAYTYTEFHKGHPMLNVSNWYLPHIRCVPTVLCCSVSHSVTSFSLTQFISKQCKHALDTVQKEITRHRKYTPHPHPQWCPCQCWQGWSTCSCWWPWLHIVCVPYTCTLHSSVHATSHLHRSQQGKFHHHIYTQTDSQVTKCCCINCRSQHQLRRE